MSQVDLDALEKRHAAATPGPYTADLRERTVRSPDDTLIVDYSMGEVASQDLVCIAALHNAFPALVAEVRALRAENGTMRNVVGCAKAWFAAEPDEDDELDHTVTDLIEAVKACETNVEPARFRDLRARLEAVAEAIVTEECLCSPDEAEAASNPCLACRVHAAIGGPS